MTTKMTPAEQAYADFVPVPLAAALGVDRSSFIAGYETALAGLPDLLAENERLRAALDALLNGLRVLVSQADHDAEREEASAMTRAELAKAAV